MRYYADQPDMQNSDKSALWTIVDTNNGLLFYDLAFFVPGPVRAKQSFRYGRNGHSFQSARVKGWQADVGWAAQQAMRVHADQLEKFPLHGDIAVELIFIMKNKYSADSDNLSKAILDALNGIVWDDDRKVIDLHIRKVNAPEGQRFGVNVMIKEIQP